jgi:D-hydroxyproline dehydrogenase subunit beta
MQSKNSADLAIVGAGVIGLAHAYHALKRGLKVVLFEREQFAIGASVRNFGMIWPIGQVPGEGLEMALRSRNHWLDVAKEAGFWINPSGSLHVVYYQDEWEVLNEFVRMYSDSGFQTQLLSPEEVVKKSPAVNPYGMVGGLWSNTECVIYSREAIRRIPLWLREKFGLLLHFGEAVKEIALPHLSTTRQKWNVEKVLICNGADFETLYPSIFKENQFVKCKLQMMKAVTKRKFSIGPSLCAGLTLRHYSAFAKCPALKKVNERYDQEQIEFKNHGIHVLLSQNNYGELIIGDTHHYGQTMEPFDREDLNEIILNYLKSFVNLGDFEITERWNGIYPKLPGKINLVVEAESNVTIVNGLGGAGMTLSFGLAEEVIQKMYG